MIARSLSQTFALVLAALTFWFIVTAPGVVDPEFAGMLYGVFAVLVVILFGMLFVALRFATAGSTTFWSGSAPPSRQVRRISIMIATALLVHLSAGWIFELQGLLGETATTTALLIWTIIPAAFVASGLVEWPTRLRRASTLRLILVGAAAVGCAMAVSYTKFANGPAVLNILPIGGLIASIASLIVAAAAEEVVCRILLLTALLDLTRSRFQAVFLSSAVFGLLHAPLELMQPVVHADWTFLRSAADAYAPMFLMQTLCGLALGVIWLRTGSIGLVVVTHAIVNVGPSMLTGF